ncbi:MAG TPA: SRPBCC domain-containing protein [Geminicoccaceae bacterium]
MSAPVCELDVRPGGRWLTTMRAEDGSEFTVSGVYREIDPPSRLVFTWAWRQDDGSRGHETLVTLEFLDRGEASELVLTQEVFQDEDARDKHASGWASALDCLEEALAVDAAA